MLSRITLKWRLRVIENDMTSILKFLNLFLLIKIAMHENNKTFIFACEPLACQMGLTLIEVANKLEDTSYMNSSITM